jgi:dual specificity phosphatase 12
MGKSRSATIILAYLLWESRRPESASSAPSSLTSGPESARDREQSSNQPLTPEAALHLLRQSRPMAEPNDGFMEQLHLYYSMGCPTSIGSHPQYQRWLYRRALQESLSADRAPELDQVHFEDEHDVNLESATGARSSTLRCRRCRQLLARSNFLADHQPAVDPVGVLTASDSTPVRCAHRFLHPLSWMRENLNQGHLDGRLSCPNARCGANVGKFAWQGLRCNCGAWTTPAFALARARIDEINAAVA